MTSSRKNPGHYLNENFDWLLDAEVRASINNVNGRWEVSLVFVDTHDPNHVLVSKISDYHSLRIAEISAHHIKQTAAKDARGTQKVTIDAYNINNN